MLGLCLPSQWVYIQYEDGKRENVANTDSLSADEAEKYRAMWEKARGKKVIRVTLEVKGDVLRAFKY